MTDMPHVPATATADALTSQLRAVVLRIVAQVRPSRPDAGANGSARAERNLAAARRREEARRAVDQLLR